MSMDLQVLYLNDKYEFCVLLAGGGVELVRRLSGAGHETASLAPGRSFHLVRE
jgi:hypothetical protein